MQHAQERPRLRPGLAAARDEHNPNFVYVWDKLKIHHQPERLTLLEFTWMQLLDGTRTVRDVQLEAMRRAGGILFSIETFTALIQRLDRAYFLDGPRFQDRLNSPVREPSCIGCYPADPAALRRQLAQLFTHRQGSGLPRDLRPDGKLRAMLAPHIDYARGGLTYTWGFKEVYERTDASLFVIIGTSHYSGHRFTLTRQDFKTPLGIAPTDQSYIDRLVKHYGDGLFDDPLAHVPEHSIELEVVFLQYLYEGKKEIRIVPLLVGSFYDSVVSGVPPRAQADIGRMVEALRKAEEETPEPICYIISGDLAHIGPKFGDPLPVEPGVLTHSRCQDEAILQAAEKADPSAFFRVIAEEADQRRICGLPPTYTVLEAARPTSGRMLHYDQYVHPEGFESVSFASVAFYR